MPEILTYVGANTEAAAGFWGAVQQFFWTPSCAQRKVRRTKRAARGTVGNRFRDMNFQIKHVGGVACMLVSLPQTKATSKRTTEPAAMLRDHGHHRLQGAHERPRGASIDEVELQPANVFRLCHQHHDTPDADEMQYGVESSRFLSQLHPTARERGERPAIRLIYAHLYKLRMAEDFPIIDRIFEDVEVQRLAPSLLVALLTITAPIKQHLESRSAFYERSKIEVNLLRGPQATSRILVGLE